jgi:hypothetical protein
MRELSKRKRFISVEVLYSVFKGGSKQVGHCEESLAERETDLAPSHFSFSGSDPEENKVILYPLDELFFSKRTL